MFKRFLFLIISATIIVALYGCCSRSKDIVFIYPRSDEVITSREVIVDEFGRIPTVTFPSGTKIEGLEKNSLTPGIVVTIVERKISAKNTSLLNKNLYGDVYIYKITAVQNPSSALESKTYVNTTEKPIKVTLPNTNSPQEISLAAIRESDSDPWRFFNFSGSDALDSIAGISVSDNTPRENSFNIYRFGTEFAVTNFEENSGNKLPETIVTNLSASSTASILVKDGKYIEDLELTGILKGIKLDSIKPTDLMARITYRNNISNEAKIKVNGVNVSQTNKEDKTVPGYSYCHSFVVDSVNDYSLMGNDGEYSFTINLNGIETESFPSSFLIEFYNKVDSEKILPYNYTEFYTLNKVEDANIVLSAVDGSIADETGNYYILNPRFKITSSYEFSEADKKKIAEAINISNVAPEKIKKGWEGRDLYISFAEELQPDTLYTISMKEIPDLETAVITPFEDFSFTTQPDVQIEVYNLDYMLYGGSTDPENPKTYSSASETFTLVNPTKPGYSFIGWTGSNGDTPQMTVIIEQGSTGDRNYTANYAAVAYSITYNLDGGVNSPENPDGFNTASETITLTNPTKLGYEFIGWTGSNGNTPQMNVSIETGSTENRTYNANFRLINYSITYNNIDGCNFANNNPVNYDITSTTINISNPTKLGYEFLGWTGTGLNSASMTLSIPIGSTENRSYSANFSLVSYSITYNNVENCTFTEDNPTSYDITSATITLNEPTRTGIEFLGWTSEDITVPQKTGVQIVQGSTGDKTFTANWNLNLNLAIAPDDGMIINEVVTANNDFPFNYANDFYYTKSAFTVTPTLAPGAVLNDVEKANILSAIIVKDSSDQTVASDTISSEWTNEGKIALTFNEHLNASTIYTISFGDVDGMTLVYTPYTFKTFYFKGRGTDENRYQVETPAQLNLVKYFLTKHYVQTNDIDIGSYNWYPIFYIYNNSYDELFFTAFTGSYYGNGKKIKNLKIRNLNYIDCGVVGLFGAVAKNDSDVNSGKIASITIEGFSIRGSDSDPYIPHYHELYYLEDWGEGATVGFITYFLGDKCTIENCKVIDTSNGESSIISDDAIVAGICYDARDDTSIKNCNVENLTIKKGSGYGICSYLSSNSNISQCNVSNFKIINGGGCGICSNSWESNISQCNVTDFYIKEGLGDGICGEFNSGNLSQCNVSSFSVIIDGTLASSFCASSGICGTIGDGIISDCNVNNYTFKGGPLDNLVGGISCFAINCNITNCNVTKATIEESDITGGISYSLGNGNISNCKVTDSIIKLKNYGGGICAYISDNNSIISNCHLASCSIELTNISTSSEPKDCYLGGICGRCDNYVSINNCYLSNSTIKATVTGADPYYTKNRFIGGICGNSPNYISDCYVSKSSINITTTDNCKIGGICGNSSNISKCHVLDSAIDITQNGSNGYIGGICASSTGEISQSYIQNSTINASIVGNTNVGGIVGDTKSSLSNCYALNTKVNVTANTDNNIGGIIGKLTDQSKLSSSYFYYDKDNESPVTLTSTSDSNKLGLLVGRDFSSSSIRNCFTNKSGTLIGESTGTVTNCYDDIASYEKFSIQTWADGAWDAYKVGADKPWPLDLNELPRD